MSLCFTVFIARKCPYKCANKFPESDLKLLLNSDCSALLLSAHSISANPPATMVAERNRRLYKWRDLSQMNVQG